MNTTIVINNNHLDWIRRNPAVFVNGLIGRIENGECDPHPGHARWNGDALPGVQVVAVEHSSQATVVIMGGNCGRAVTSCGSSGKGGAPASDVDALRAMASKLGYTVRQKSAPRKTVPDLTNNVSVPAGTSVNPFTGEKSKVSHSKRASRKTRRGKKR